MHDSRGVQRVGDLRRERIERHILALVSQDTWLLQERRFADLYSRNLELMESSGPNSKRLGQQPSVTHPDKPSPNIRPSATTSVLHRRIDHNTFHVFFYSSISVPVTMGARGSPPAKACQKKIEGQPPFSDQMNTAWENNALDVRGDLQRAREEVTAEAPAIHDDRRMEAGMKPTRSELRQQENVGWRRPQMLGSSLLSRSTWTTI